MIIDGKESRSPPHFVSSMIKAIARAHYWLDQIVQGQLIGGRDGAKKTGFDERYISLIMKCGFLAPDIIEAIIDGQQPPNFTLAKITSGLPMNWAEQRSNLGFSTPK